VNEYLLFHGTDKETIDIIIDLGFDERYAEEKGMFGPGIYFAENSSKSNQYVSCPKCSSGAIPKKNRTCTCKDPDIVYQILLTRVCLGNPYVCTDYKHWKENAHERLNKNRENYTPFPNGGCMLCVNNVLEHHSVYCESKKGGGPLRAREFAVYDKRQTYPEFIIHYKRLSNPPEIPTEVEY